MKTIDRFRAHVEEVLEQGPDREHVQARALFWAGAAMLLKCVMDGLEAGERIAEPGEFIDIIAEAKRHCAAVPSQE